MIRRSLITALAAVALVAPLLVSVPSVRAAEGTSGGGVSGFQTGLERLAGADRYDTAISVSRRYAPSVDAVFIATGQNFPDALSAAAAAAVLKGPLLLTPTSLLPSRVREEIVRLKPQTIYVAGGAGAVSDTVLRALSGIAPVVRLGGTSRYETGNAIVARAFPSASHAFVATGRTFPDALAATGAAGSVSAPVILVDGARSSLPTDTVTLLGQLGVRSVTVAGGAGAVSDGILRELSARFDTQRLGGAGRYDTAATINDMFFPEGSAQAAFLATGTNFPDALAGAALAGRMTSPVYVTTAACVPEAAHISLQRLRAPTTVALGGVSVVGDSAAKNVGCLSAATPRVTGAVRVNSTLTAQPGSWTEGTSFRYRWLADGAAIAGATGPALTLPAGLAGKQISVRVTGSKTGYLTSSATSARTARVSYPGGTPPTDSWNCPSWAPIKGNASSMIYHLPGGAFYSRTNPEDCFRTEADARAAGYRRSQR